MKLTSYGGYDASWVGEGQRRSADYDYQQRLRNQQKAAGSNKSNNKRRIKKLNYNPREVSMALRRSVKSSTVSVVLTRTRSTLAVLLKKQGTAQYDEKALENAIIHARKMVRCSKMKLNHLKQEEQMERLNQKKNKDDNHKADKSTREQQEQQQRRLRQQRVQQRHIRQMTEEELLVMQKIRSREQELEQKRTQNRNKETKELDKADLEYMKRELERMSSQNAAEIAGYMNEIQGMRTDRDGEGYDYAEEGVIFEMTSQVAELPTAQDEPAVPSGGDAGGGGMDIAL